MPEHPMTLRVQIHLNLANPQLAESVVRIQNKRGAWISVAYATKLQMHNVVPVINEQARKNIENGASKKTPHAFLEGELLGFEGRLRDKAPDELKTIFASIIEGKDTFAAAGAPINYNPRFASCFYLEEDTINKKLVSCETLNVLGWRFLGVGLDHLPLLDQERAPMEAIHKVSTMERLAMRRGRATTERMKNIDIGHYKNTLA